MLTNFKIIPKEEYFSLQAKVLFQDDVPECFAVIENSKIAYKFSWHGTIIEPLIFHLYDDVFLIGVNLDLAIFHTEKALEVFNYNFDTYFYDVIRHDNYIFIATELDVLQMNILTLEIVKTYGLPDIYENAVIYEKSLTVNCMDGNSYEYEII